MIEGGFGGGAAFDTADAVDLADDLQAIAEAESRLMGYKVRQVAALAALRPHCLDVPAGRPGARAADADDGEMLPDTSEFFADELASILNCSRTAASVLAGQAFALCGQLRATLEALEDVAVDWPRARLIADELSWAARYCHPALIAEIEAAALTEARALSVRQLKARIRAELIARAPEAAEQRRRDAGQHADVTMRAAADGMATLLASMPQARAQAVWDTVNTLARQAKTAGDQRPLGVLRALILEELITRPWDDSRESVTATLVVHAPLLSLFTDDPDIPPGTPRPADETGHGGKGEDHSEGAEDDDSEDVAAGDQYENDRQDDDGQDDDRQDDSRQDENDGHGSSAATPRPPAWGRIRWLGGAGTDPMHTVPAVNGQPITAGALRELLHRLDALCPGGLQAPTGGSLLIALHDPATGRLCGVLTRPELERLVRNDSPTAGMPPPVDRYTPTPAQRRFLATRDRTCRHPGCTNRAAWADLDHVIPHAEGGDTCCTNLSRRQYPPDAVPDQSVDAATTLPTKGGLRQDQPVAAGRGQDRYRWRVCVGLPP